MKIGFWKISMLFMTWLLGASVFLLSQNASALFEQGLMKENAEGDLTGAIEIFDRVVEDNAADPSIRAKAQLHVGMCYEKMGQREARVAYQKVIDSYPQQHKEVASARQRLTALSKTSDADKRPVFTTRQVLAGPIPGISSLSPDGRYLSFMDKTGQVAVRDLETNVIRRLTNIDGGGDPTSARWSPDGKHIAFVWDTGPYEDLRVISAGGGKSRILADFSKTSWMQVFDWSPDGKKILLWVETKDTRQIALVSSEDGATTVLKTFKGLGEWSQAMRFSRDGQYIAYDYPQEKGVLECDIFVISADGKREFTLVQHPADDRLLGWPPNGASILFASDRQGSSDIWLQAVSGVKVQGLPALVKRGVDQIMPLGFTHGGAFYYRLRLQGLDVYSTSIDFRSGKVLAPPEVIIKRNEGRNSWPDYSPDGRYLAYLTTQSRLGFEFNTLCIRSLESGKEREFASGFKRLAEPQWSPDGQSLYLTAWDDQGAGIYRVNAQTGEFTLIVRNNRPSDTFVNRFITHHRVTPDGKTIIYLNAAYPPSTMIARNLITGEEKQLYTGNFLRFSISPDGQWLALLGYGWEKQVLRVMSLSGGWVRDLLQFETASGTPAAIEWTADGKYIIFQRPPSAKDDTQFPIWRIVADGGEPQKLNLPMVVSQGLSAHPDGQHLVFCSDSSQLNTTAGIWIMENFLPPAASASQ